jgi:hypothetical protein
LAFDYIVEGAPIFPACPNPALLLDKQNNNLYISNGTSTSWIIIGTFGGQNDSVQNLVASQTISFVGSVNTFIKAVAGTPGITLTLPNAIGVSGQQVTIIMVDAGVGGVTIAAQEVNEVQQTINGSIINYELNNQYQAVTLESDGANWFVRSTAN